MTRLSDSLHGAADRAPIEDTTISVESAARRVRRQRATRGAGNVAAGVGALALVIGGVFAPGLGASHADPAAPASKVSNDGGGVSNESAFAPEASADMRIAEWGFCGSYPLRDWATDDDSFSLAVTWDGADVDPGSSLKVPVVTSSKYDADVTTTGPIAVVLWEGMVVARVDSADVLEELTLAARGESTSKVKVPLASCFDDEPLPASKYELLVTQTFADVSDGSTPEPSEAPAPEPMPVEPYLFDSTFRAVAKPIGFAVAGEPVENPFGQYIAAPWTPPVMPDNMLTPEIARDLFTANATTTQWDFATGSSRYVFRSEQDNGDNWDKTYFGCPWDGSNAGFPAKSADLGLLTASYSGPSSIGVSYGWIVDDNPKIHVGVTNTSEYALPGFYGQPSRTLFLVKDGKVVAEAYPTDINRNGDVAFASADGAATLRSDAAPESNKIAIAPDTAENYWGVLDAGGSLSGDYLWREVNGCWTESGPLDVASGTYTLVLSQSMYLETGNNGGDVQNFAYDDTAAATSGDAAQGGGTELVDPGFAVGEPNPGQPYEWAELQVWFAVGTVTVTS